MSVETRSVNTSQEGSVSHSQTFTEAGPTVITSVLTVNVYAELLVMDVQRSTAVCVCVCWMTSIKHLSALMLLSHHYIASSSTSSSNDAISNTR